jgi:hypothetical protein
VIFNVKICIYTDSLWVYERKTSLDFHDRYIYYYFTAVAACCCFNRFSLRLFSLSLTFLNLKRFSRKLKNLSQSLSRFECRYGVGVRALSSLFFHIFFYFSHTFSHAKIHQLRVKVKILFEDLFEIFCYFFCCYSERMFVFKKINSG